MNATGKSQLALWSAVLLLLTLHADRSDSFDEPSTYVGIVCGIALVGTAWFVGKRIRARRTAR